MGLVDRRKNNVSNRSEIKEEFLYQIHRYISIRNKNCKNKSQIQQIFLIFLIFFLIQLFVLIFGFYSKRREKKICEKKSTIRNSFLLLYVRVWVCVPLAFFLIFVCSCNGECMIPFAIQERGKHENTKIKLPVIFVLFHRLFRSSFFLLFLFYLSLSRNVFGWKKK